jgi:hypothetical protein
MIEDGAAGRRAPDWRSAARRAAGDVLHHQYGEPWWTPDVVHGGAVHVVELAHRHRLALKRSTKAGVAEAGVEELHGDGAPG